MVSTSSGGSSAPVAARGRRLADQQPQHVGVALGVAAAGADADRVGGHRAAAGPSAVARVVEQRGAGRGAQLHRRGAGRAGVRRDAAQQLGDRGRRHRQRAVRAADRAEPTATGETTTSVGAEVRRSRRRRRPRRRSRRARRPRGSARRAGRAVHRALGDREPLEDARRQVAHRRRRGRRAASRSRMSRQVRWCTESATSTWQRVAAKPLRVTCSTRSATGSGATASTAAWSTSTGTPAPSSAPSSMSPLAPEEASTQIVTRGVRASRRGVRGPPGRRTRRRRTRCRC